MERFEHQLEDPNDVIAGWAAFCGPRKSQIREP